MPSAQRVNWAKFRVAVVSAVAVTILATFLYLLAGGALFQEKATLYVYIPDATGLFPGSPVRVDGIVVGKVDKVELRGGSSPERTVRLTATVESHRLDQIAVDSFAQIASDTLVGDRSVAISSGNDPRRVKPGSEILFRAEPELLQSLDLSQFEGRLRAVDGMITDLEQGRGRVGEFVRGEKMYGDLLRRMEELQTGIRAATDSATKVGKLLYSDELYQQTRRTLADFDAALARLQSGQGNAGRILRDPAQYEELRTAAARLRGEVAKARAGAFLASDAMWLDWNRRVASLIRSVDEAAAGPLLNSAQTYENLDGAAREFRDAMRDFRAAPQKYLRLKVF